MKKAREIYPYSSQESPQIISRSFNAQLSHELTYYFWDYSWVTSLLFLGLWKKPSQFFFSKTICYIISIYKNTNLQADWLKLYASPVTFNSYHEYFLTINYKGSKMIKMATFLIKISKNYNARRWFYSKFILPSPSSKGFIKKTKQKVVCGRLTFQEIFCALCFQHLYWQLSVKARTVL